MPRFIVKPDPDRDEYVEWSSIVESWTFLGTRAEMLAHLRAGRDYVEFGEQAPNVRLDRADKNGTSSFLGEGAYGDRLVFEQRGTIACARLGEFVRALADGDLQAALRMCEPWEDEERVRGLEP
jgi:hypothetical protein